MMKGKLHIHYFSGTGNAKFAAGKIAEHASEQHIECEVINIAAKMKTEIKHDSDDSLVFLYPTHGFNAPPIVLNYVAKFPKGKSRVYLMNTRGGMKLYKLHTPGLSGVALLLPALMLWIKGYKIGGFRSLDMPSNWISLHPGIRNSVIVSIAGHCSQTLKRFSSRIVDSKPAFKGLWWLPVDLAIVPVSIGYYLVGRFALAKSFYANYACSDCGLCEKECPVHAIKKVQGRMFWTYHCESCMKCMNNCPERAIETGHGMVIPVWWVAFSFIPNFIVHKLMELEFIHWNKAVFDTVFYLTQAVVGLAIAFFAYRVFHYLLGFKWVNRLITYTSLSHYTFWRRFRLRKALKKN